ncbi:MAG: Trm112 family protein [Candidatus Geothermarchaeales archaeon]
MELLACPMCRCEELELIVLSESEEIDEGVIACTGCGRYYPIIETIPVMLPDQLRDKGEDLSFLERWRGELPRRVLLEGRPHSLGEAGR